MKKSSLLLISLIFVCILSAVPIRILHTNDTHGIYQAQKTKSGDLIGGYISLEHHLSNARSTAARSIYVDAGDQQTGSIFASMSHNGAIGGAVIEAFNNLSLDATTFGNHEFDQSFANTIKLTELADYPFVSTNLRTKQGHPFGNNPYKIIHLDSLKIGIMGLTLVELPEKVKRENISELNILPYKQAIDEYLDYVDANSDLIILLTHLGFEADSLLAATLDNRIDLIIGGHSHVNIEEPWQVNGIYIASAGSHNMLLGQLDINVVNDRITSLTTTQIPLWQPKEQPITKLANFVNILADSIQASMGKSIARIPEDWKPDKFQETAVSKWVANSLLAEYQQPYKPDIAIINNGGIRKYIPAGDVTLGDMHELLPFNNYVVLFSCYGEDLLKMDALNKQNAIDKPYDIVQTAGIKEVVQACPGGHGHSKKVWEVNKRALEPDTKYRVVSHDYIVGQWDKYLGFEPFEVQETGDLILEAMIKQLILQYGKK
jgi:2',3'-cyclic-nucleotide 2'-phosphodiesterase (5'-nucleotidase family)